MKRIKSKKNKKMKDRAEAANVDSESCFTIYWNFVIHLLIFYIYLDLILKFHVSFVFELLTVYFSARKPITN